MANLNLWLVTRKDIPVPMEPSYVVPWQVMFNRQPRTFVYRQRASALDRAGKLAANGALTSIDRYVKVEKIVDLGEIDWSEGI
jgi:hypothetical protein